jgi:hypothetical protein
LADTGDVQHFAEVVGGLLACVVDEHDRTVETLLNAVSADVQDGNILPRRHAVHLPAPKAAMTLSLLGRGTVFPELTDSSDVGASSRRMLPSGALG